MPPMIEPFNFTESFRKTVARYDTLSAASRADYERTRAKMFPEESNDIERTMPPMKNLPIDPKWREKQILKEIENMDLSDESNDIERSPDMIPDFNNGLPRLAMWIYRASPYAVIIAALVLAFCAGRAFGADLLPIVEEPHQECSTEPVRIKGRFCVRISDGQITHPSQCCIVAPDGGTFTPADPQEPPGREHDDEEGDI